MSFLLPCPNCGSRPVDEFRFGGEIRAQPKEATSPEAWRAYLYDRANVKGPQQEWWYHRHGCRRWFVATRDTRTNTVLETGWFTDVESPPQVAGVGLDSAQGAQNAEARDSRSSAAAGDDVSGIE